MQRLRRHRFPLSPFRAAAAVALALTPHLTGWTADIDIYGPTGAGSAPNLVFLLDNTSNWSANNQAWSKSSVDAKCSAMSEPDRTTCLKYSDQIFLGAPKATQGQVQLRALRLVLNELVCSGKPDALRVNVGLSLMGQQSVLNNGHGVGIINFAVQPLTGTADTVGSSCKAIIDKLNLIDAKIEDPAYKAPSSANYGAALFEIFKYFGGHTNPALAATDPNPPSGAPVGATGYGPVRYSKPNVLDDVAAFTSSSRTTYQSPLTPANSCGGNYVVLVGNTYPNFEPNDGGPTIYKGINYTPTPISSLYADVSRYADEWASFLANTDVSDLPGIQKVFTYAIDTYNDKPDPAQGRLLMSMAREGGIGTSAYFKVGGDISALINSLKDILVNIASVDSVFTATTLPVSTTTQGTFLNQIFVGMFRPDANFSPRWVGNLKQYQLGFVNGALDLVDKNNKSAVVGGTGFFNAVAESFWTEPSVFFDQKPSGTPASASDLPDGPIVEKGGAAQQLRKVYEQGASTRNVLTLAGTTLKSFDTSSGLSPEIVNWARGENNVDASASPKPPGAEEFTGSYKVGTEIKPLGATGARHSIHGDVLHSRPVALNYGNGNVIVYYGTNDGFLRAVNGNKTGTGAGQELWSFIGPEHYGVLERLRAGTPKLHLPETNSSGGTTTALPGSAPKSYGMDGPIGVYARYGTSGAIGADGTAAWIFPTQRRGGRNVYAFDVSNPATPGFKWKIEGGSGSYAKLAQTWSMPKAVVFKDADKTPKAPILIMGGGYDPAEDKNDSDGIGNVIYIVNGGTGALIAALETSYSVPSDVTVVDVDGNGEPDRAYVADVRGNLYRVDFPTSGDRLAASTWANVKAVKIAELDGKVFYPPDAVVTKNFVAVMVGTGDREKPLLSSTKDRFFLIKDNVGAPRGSALTSSDLAHVARVDKDTMRLIPETPANAATEGGCYISLATNGEKVINAPFTIAGATYFGTNRPKPVSTTSCSGDLGEAYAYKFPLFCTVPATPIRVAGGGLLPSPVGGIVTIDVNGVPTKVPFLIGGGSGGSAFKPEEPKPPVPPRRTRQNWRIDNTNR